LELLVQLGDEKASKTLKLFIFLKKVLVCLFPINIRDFKPKRAFFGQKQGKNGGKQTNSKIFLENRQSKYFCLTYFSKLNRDQVEKKLWHFEDNLVSGGGEKPCRKSRKSDTTFRWVLMCKIFFNSERKFVTSKVVSRSQKYFSQRQYF